MAKQNDNPEQSKEQKPTNETRYQSVPKGQLKPIEDRLKEHDYPPHIIENYPKLIRNDLHLAEIYRLAATGSPDPIIEKRKILNPIQTKVDGKGRIWVDVLIRKKEDVTVKALKKVLKIQGKPGRGDLFSGRVLVDRLPELSELAIKVQAARPIAPFLDLSVPLINADKNSLTSNFPSAAGQKDIDGSGVIVGIVDGVLDFRHPNFVTKIKEGGVTKKSSRFLYLWDQTGQGKPPTGYKDGVEYDQNRINDALNSANHMPTCITSVEGNTEYDRHGTHVTDIAAGRSPDPRFPGVAPGADIIYVHLGKPTDPGSKADEELKSLGSSEYLYNAVKYIFEKADQIGKPVVVNLSLGSYGGSHDGTSILENKFDKLLRAKPGRAIVIAAGNGLREEIHTSGTVIQGGEPYVIEWYIPSLETRIIDFRQELEIWYDKNAALKVEIFTPDGTSLGVSRLGFPSLSSEILPDTQTPRWIVYHTRPDAVAGEDENHVDILVDDRKREDDADEADLDVKGIWRLELSLDPELGVNADVEFHAWIERNDNCQSKFRNNSIREYTLNSIGNAELPIVVGSFDFVRSSSGPSRNKWHDKPKKQKPELNAPGLDIFAARAAPYLMVETHNCQGQAWPLPMLRAWSP